MSYVDRLLAAYEKFMALPWRHDLAPAQRVWMAVYPPDQERRLRLYRREFERVTGKHGHAWKLIDVTTSFEQWMASHDYRQAYFADPELLWPALPGFFDHLTGEVRRQLDAYADEDGVVALLGAGALFGLGPAVKVSALLNAAKDAVAGRLLVFFPGEHEGNNYRLLDAQDGWNYLAVPITPNGNR
jgi:hypothetical protein